jgi:hypothetical protein
LVFLVFLLLLALVLVVRKLSFTASLVEVEPYTKQVQTSIDWQLVGKVLVENGKIVWFDYIAD